MRFLIYVLFAAVTLTSCNDAPVMIKDSAGRMNDILLVMDNELWENEVGDSLRQVLAAPLDGLVREEPQFTLNQIKPEAFRSLIKKNRNYMKVELSDQKEGVNVTRNLYATPQTGVIIRAKDTTALINEIMNNAEQIREIFKTGEIAEKQALMKRTQLNVDAIKERFGVEFTIPRSYRYAATTDDDFFWLRRNIKEGTMDIMVYEVPREAISRDSNVVANIIKVRDSIGRLKIPVDDGGAFITEPAFSPYVNESQIDGQFAFETKGLWEVKNKWMSGPFLNYAIYNKKKNNWLILEGYIYAPSAAQRNYLFELEAILKSTRFVKEEE